MSRLMVWRGQMRWRRRWRGFERSLFREQDELWGCNMGRARLFNHLRSALKWLLALSYFSALLARIVSSGMWYLHWISCEMKSVCLHVRTFTQKYLEKHSSTRAHLLRIRRVKFSKGNTKTNQLLNEESDAALLLVKVRDNQVSTGILYEICKVTSWTTPLVLVNEQRFTRFMNLWNCTFQIESLWENNFEYFLYVNGVRSGAEDERSVHSLCESLCLCWWVGKWIESANIAPTCLVISSWSSLGRPANTSNLVPTRKGIAVLLNPLACLYHSFIELSVLFLERSNMKRIATASLQTSGSMLTNSRWPVRREWEWQWKWFQRKVNPPDKATTHHLDPKWRK